MAESIPGASRSSTSWLLLIVGALVMSAGGAFAATGSATDSATSGGDAWENAEAIPEPSDERVIGRVTGVLGNVYAQQPGAEPRRLVNDSPIYPGDRLVTGKGAQLGILSGDYYAGLNEDTTLTYAMAANGAPSVRLDRGHVRVIDASEAGASPEFETPGIVVAAAGRDTEIYAFPEKAFIVSMVCAREGQIQAQGAGGASQTVSQGGCAISKPVEGLFLAGPAGAPLPIIAQAANALPPVGAAGTHFSPNDVAGGPGAVNQLFAWGPAIGPAQQDTLWNACDTPASAAACSGALAGAANPPTNPPIPGPPPPPPPNPPTLPPIPGPPPPPPLLP